MDGLHFLLPAALIFAAYFVKGYSGFGPALILIPTLSLVYNPHSAILLVTLFDLIAGVVLLISVWRSIRWKTTFSVLLAFFPGALLGARLMASTPVEPLKKILAIVLLLFIALIWIKDAPEKQQAKLHTDIWQGLAAFGAGFTGGLTGISGPLLVVYFKLAHPKTFFRNQLIAIFAFGAAWRLFLYHSFHAALHIHLWQLIIFALFMLSALFFGSRFQLKIDEQTFNRSIALILLIPCLTLLI